jgi:hypothetical protein
MCWCAGGRGGVVVEASARLDDCAAGVQRAAVNLVLVSAAVASEHGPRQSKRVLLTPPRESAGGESDGATRVACVCVGCCGQGRANAAGDVVGHPRDGLLLGLAAGGVFLLCDDGTPHFASHCIVHRSVNADASRSPSASTPLASPAPSSPAGPHALSSPTSPSRRRRRSLALHTTLWRALCGHSSCGRRLRWGGSLCR